MKTMSKSAGFLCALLVSMTQFLSAQAGANVYVGPSVMFSNDKVVTGSGEAHYGYVAGIHGRLNSDNMYFLFTGEYGAFDFLSNKDLKFIGGDDLTYGKFKIGLGFDVLKFAPKSYIRTKIQGTILFVNKFNGELLKDPKLVANGYTSVNDGIAGMATCLGVNLGSMTLDLEYEYGLFNIFKQKKDSKLNFLNLIAGYRF